MLLPRAIRAPAPEQIYYRAQLELRAADMVEVVNRGTNVPRNTRAPSVADTAAFLLMVKARRPRSPPDGTHTQKRATAQATYVHRSYASYG